MGMVRYIHLKLQERLTSESACVDIAAYVDLSNYVMDVIRNIVENMELIKGAQNIMINNEVKSYSRLLREEGKAEGRAEGKAEGRTEGQDLTLKIIKQLSDKGLPNVIVQLGNKEISIMECVKKYNLML